MPIAWAQSLRVSRGERQGLRDEHVTFNMNQAWDEAIRTLKANKELLLILAGLFFFVPALALGIFRPETLTGPAGPDGQPSMEALIAFYNRNGGWMLLVQLIQSVGMLSILALFIRRRATVGESILAGLRALLPLFIATFFVALVFSALGGMIVGFAAAASQDLAVVLAVLVALVLLFVLARLIPLMPLLVAERRFNPFSALVDSWRLTAGAGWRILSFLALILVAVIVISLLVGGLVSLITAFIASPAAANFIAAALSGLLGAVVTCLILAVIMAIYRQLTAPASAAGIPRTHADTPSE